MARIDKYDPVDGGYRAPLAADFVVGDRETCFGVGHDVNGRVVKGAGQSGLKGVLVLTQAKKARDVVDVMTDGEVVEFIIGVAGTSYTANTVTGVVSSAVASATQIYVGHTVEAGRLIVRAAR